MNVPPNTRPFSLELAQQGHPLVTRAGQPAKFIAYVPEAIPPDRLIILIKDVIYGYHDNGMWRNIPDEDSGLFLAPVGYCEGKPVFANDVLTGTDSNSTYKGKEFVVECHHDNFYLFKWPSKAPVVETRYTGEELQDLFADFDDFAQPSYKHIANKAIERAILDGDVVPTSVVKSMLLSAHGDRNNITCEHMAQIAIDKYLESL